MEFKLRKKEKFEEANKFVERIQEIQKEAKAALGKAQEDIKKYADRHRGEAEEYQVGDLVLLSCNDKASRNDCLITLNVMRERKELDGVSWWIGLPTYTQFLFVYVYA